MTTPQERILQHRLNMAEARAERAESKLHSLVAGTTFRLYGQLLMVVPVQATEAIVDALDDIISEHNELDSVCIGRDALAHAWHEALAACQKERNAPETQLGPALDRISQQPDL